MVKGDRFRWDMPTGVRLNGNETRKSENCGWAFTVPQSMKLGRFLKDRQR